MPVECGVRRSMNAFEPFVGVGRAKHCLDAFVLDAERVGEGHARRPQHDSLALRSASGLFSPSHAASSRAVAMTWSAATTRFTRPIESAEAASIFSPSRAMATCPDMAEVARVFAVMDPRLGLCHQAERVDAWTVGRSLVMERGERAGRRPSRLHLTFKPSNIVLSTHVLTKGFVSDSNVRRALTRWRQDMFVVEILGTGR